MKLSYEGLRDRAAWEAAGVALPAYDWREMAEETARHPVWIHFGAGNIFRGFLAALQDTLLSRGLAQSGILAADTFDFEILERIIMPHDGMTLLVRLLPDGTMEKQIVASVARGLRAGGAYPDDLAALRGAFENPSLQMVSFTITEKGYALRGPDGAWLPAVAADLAAGPEKCMHVMSRVCALLCARFAAGGAPLALVSMDNCSHNGEKLRAAVTEIARRWRERDFVSPDFVAWLEDEHNVSFPWTMIDKITPRPAPVVTEALAAAGIEDMTPIVTAKNTFIAPFVNAEKPQYLVIEDRFPNGRPPLEAAGVCFTDRETVNKTEKMKVTTCLNPLHTALAVYGCLLGYETIAAEMRDASLSRLARTIGYDEGLPVVTDPGILSPGEFLREVVEERLPNPFLPDTPQRIATDTSQKIPIRFGETIKSYLARGADLTRLIGIPLALAGWLRYLLGVDDEGRPMPVSADPMLPYLTEMLCGVRLGAPQSAPDEALAPLLRNEAVFGTDLCAAGLAPAVGALLREMLAGPGAVRAALRRHLGA